MARKKVTPEVVEEMRGLREEGMSYSKIASKLGLNRMTVYSYLRKKTGGRRGGPDQARGAGVRITRLGKEKRGWLDITNFNVWQVLKLIDGGRTHIREIIGAFRGSSTTLELTVNKLVRWGLLADRRDEAWPFKRTLALTRDGAKMLSLLDKIGEIVKRIRARGAQRLAESSKYRKEKF